MGNFVWKVWMEFLNVGINIIIKFNEIGVIVIFNKSF